MRLFFFFFDNHKIKEKKKGGGVLDIFLVLCLVEHCLLLEYTPGSSCCLLTLCSLFLYYDYGSVITNIISFFHLFNVYGYSSFHVYPVTYLSLLITRGHGYLCY